jgi:ABC-2 type transport system ATP-binding protein
LVIGDGPEGIGERIAGHSFPIDRRIIRHMMKEHSDDPQLAIEIEDLRVVRGDRVVIPGLTISVPVGQVTGLLGPSGCGKSTLMRAIVGVQKVAGGSVLVLGRPAGSPELRHLVGYVTQAPSVYGDLSVRENLGFFASVLGAPKSDPDRVIDAVELGTHADARVDQLSGGQRARASLAVALLGDPQILVLDEPTVGLDPVLRRDLWRLFHELADGGVAVMVSSHVMDEAERCKRLLLMREGGILADESPAALLDRTGADDVESAFLSIVDRAGAAA